MSREAVVAAALRAKVKTAAARVGDVTHVPRIGPLDVSTFRALGRAGIPFVIVGLIEHWPIAKLTAQDLVDEFGELPVRVRAGDYVEDAFSAKRSESASTLAAYLKAVTSGSSALPPYLGNQRLPELASLCRWPPYFDRFDVAKIWLGPAGTVTPLHCDYVDNLFAQIWGRKQFILCAPHHEAILRTWKSNEALFASHFDPEGDAADRHPGANLIPWLTCVVNAGELLYLPAGWFHHVRALEFSLSANRWSLEKPLVAMDEGAVVATLKRPADITAGVSA